MIRSNALLSNTLALGSSAEYAINIDDVADAREAITFARSEGITLRCLGEGSNVVLMPKVAGLVCRVTMAQTTVVATDDAYVVIDVGAGKNWHELVQETLIQGWYGLENLSLIPGSVGASPVQNIGAYGVELSECLESVEVIDQQGKHRVMTAQECVFGYRDSIFKRQQASGEQPLIIVSIRLRLSKNPTVNLSYKELAVALEVSGALSQGHALPSPQQVADAVVAIRRAKLPDPKVHPNAGSFFKNPVVDERKAAALRELSITPYPFEGAFKVSAAQLIDQAGFKDLEQGPIGCWSQQPLVLVNNGKATAQNVLDFAKAIQRGVLAKYQLALELEPSVLS